MREFIYNENIYKARIRLGSFIYIEMQLRGRISIVIYIIL